MKTMRGCATYLLIPLFAAPAATAQSVVVDASADSGSVVANYVIAYRAASRAVLDLAYRTKLQPDRIERLTNVRDSLDAIYRDIVIDLRKPTTREKSGKRLALRTTSSFGGVEFRLVNEFQQAGQAVLRQARASLTPAEYTNAGLTADGRLMPFEAYIAADRRIAMQLADERIARYRTRYTGGEVLNPWIEVQLDNIFTRNRWFGASATSPPRAEPIARFSPVLFSTAAKNAVSVAEVGLNFYAFGGFMTKVAPVGAALTFGDPTQEKLLLPDVKHWRPGVMLHARRVELGWIRDYVGKDHLLTSFNFHVLPNRWF
jgi:hypothetical protein